MCYTNPIHVLNEIILISAAVIVNWDYISILATLLLMTWSMSASQENNEIIFIHGHNCLSFITWTPCRTVKKQHSNTQHYAICTCYLHSPSDPQIRVKFQAGTVCILLLRQALLYPLGRCTAFGSLMLFLEVKLYLCHMFNIFSVARHLYHVFSTV